MRNPRPFQCTVLLAVCAAVLSLSPGCATGPKKSAAAVPLKRSGNEIMVSGQLFDIGTPVVLWTDPGGFVQRNRTFTYVWEAHEGTGKTIFLTGEGGIGKTRVAAAAAQTATDDGWNVAFGRALKDVVLHSPRRIAVIASGDLSHALSSNAPAGYRPEGEEFDGAVRQAIEHMATSQLLSLPASTVSAAAECAYRPLLMLFGLLEGMKVRPEMLGYESPFGVGYLTVQFHLA